MGRRSAKKKTQMCENRGNPDTTKALGDQFYKQGVEYFQEKKYSDAENAYKRSLEIYTKVLDKNLGTFGGVHNNLAFVYLGEEKNQKAIFHFKKSLKFLSQSDDKEQIPCTLNEIARIYTTEGNYPEAEKYHKDALEIFKSLHGENHESVARVSLEIGGVLLRRFDFDEAIKWLQESLRIYRSLYGNNHETVKDTLSKLIFARKMQSDKRLKKIERVIYGEDNQMYTVDGKTTLYTKKFAKDTED